MPPVRLTDAAEDRFWRGVRHAGRFFMGGADVQKALEKLDPYVRETYLDLWRAAQVRDPESR